MKKVTLDEVRSFYQQFYGAGDGEIVISGQFDPEQMRKLVTELFGDWKSPSRYQRVPDSYAKVDAVNHKIETPDKQNATISRWNAPQDEGRPTPTIRR